MKKVKYFIVPLLVCLIMVTGCGKKKENNQNNSTTTTTATAVTKTQMNVEVKNNMLYVNGNKVDFYSIYDDKDFYVKEEDFYTCDDESYLAADGKTYNSESFEMNYEVGNEFVFVSISPCHHSLNKYYFVNQNGKIIKTVGGNNGNESIKLSGDGTYISVDKVSDNTIYLKTHEVIELYEETCCNKINNGHGNDIYQYIDKLTYLGNDEFKLEKKDSTETYKEIAVKNNYNC